MARQTLDIEVRDARTQPFFWIAHEFMGMAVRSIGPMPSLVYVALAHHANKDQRCWPSVPTLAIELGISQRTVTIAINRLLNESMITVTRESGKHNVYQLTDSTSWACCQYVQNEHLTPAPDAGVSEQPLQDVQGTPASGAGVLSIEQESVTRSIPPLTPPDGGEGVRQLEESFLRFWAAYPKRKSKARALKAWTKLKPSEQLVDAIIAAIERATTSVQWTKEQGKFIPYPASWLNDHAWEDEYQPGEIQGKPSQEGPPADPPKRRIIKRQDGSLAELKDGEIIPIEDPRALSPPPVNGNASFNVSGFIADIAASFGSPG